MKNLLNINSLLVVVILLLSISLSIGESYASYILDHTKKEEYVVKPDCFKLIMDDENAISLSTAYPIKETEVKNLIPYKISIKNTCNYEESYVVSLEELNNSTLDDKYVRIKIDNNDSKLLSEIPLSDSITLSNTKTSRTILNGKLSYNESHTYNIRLYLDENSLQEEVENQNITTKVSNTII